jgi:HTH-type transcriptional regulator/antitoxin HigA
MRNTAVIDEKRYGKLLLRILPRPIQTEKEDQRAVALLEELDLREDLSPEEEQLAELLTLLIEDFEERRYAMKPAPPLEMLKVLIEDRGLRHKDIWPVFGNKGLASEVLNGKRAISKAQAKKLAEYFQVPVELFI